MQALSALDAISPAWTRTRLMLFAPFRAGRSWKLAATAYLARAGTMFVPFQLIYLLLLPSVRRSNGAMAAGLLVVGVVAFTAVVLGFFYLGTRLQFVLFELVLVRGELVAPAWGRYARQSAPWMWFKVLAGTALAVVMAAPVAGYMRQITALLSGIHPGQQPPPEFFTALFAGYGALLLVFGTFFFLSAVLTDLVLAPMALGGASLRDGLREAGKALRSEPGEFAVFALVKMVLAVTAYLMAVVAVEVVFVLLALLLGVLAGGAGYLLSRAGVPTSLLWGVGIVLGVVVYLVALVYGLLLAAGAVSIFVEAHALYFLGGRFPRVGELLEGSETLPFTPGRLPEMPMAPPPPQPLESPPEIA